jgi:hypothetical protein
MDKGNLFYDFLFEVARLRNDGLSMAEIKKHTTLENRVGFSGDVPDKYQSAIYVLAEKNRQLDEFNIPISDWEQYWPAFRIFLQQIGIRLKDFDAALTKSTGPGRNREDFRRFLTCYFLLIVDRTSAATINDVYSSVMDSAWQLFTKETAQLLHGAYLTIGGILYSEYDLLLNQDVAILKSCLLPSLISDGYKTTSKAICIFTLPYQDRLVEPELFLAYLFQFRGKELLPILHQVLDALLDVAMGGRELPENKLLMKRVV